MIQNYHANQTNTPMESIALFATVMKTIMMLHIFPWLSRILASRRPPTFRQIATQSIANKMILARDDPKQSLLGSIWKPFGRA